MKLIYNALVNSLCMLHSFETEYVRLYRYLYTSEIIYHLTLVYMHIILIRSFIRSCIIEIYLLSTNADSFLISSQRVFWCSEARTKRNEMNV